jgi:4-amino-4-deoxy-L-arabinose transferase-like glycosyltransferase
VPARSRGGGEVDRSQARSAWGLLSAAVVLALSAQHRLTPLGAPRAFEDLPHEQAPFGFVLFLIAGAAAAVCIWFDDRALAARGLCRDSGGAPDPPRERLAARPLNAAVVCVAMSAAVAFIDVQNRWVIYGWAAGLALLIAAVPRQSRRARRPMSSAQWAVLVAVLIAAALLRGWSLGDVPAQVHGDEAACGIEARRILAGDVPNLLGLGWYEIPYLSFAISAASMAVFGDDLFGLRAASVLQGTASVAVLFFLVRRLYGTRTASIAAFLLAVSHWHIHFSRIGTDYIQASLASLLALLFFVRARQDGVARDWVWAGLAVGLACSVYYAGRVTVVIIGAVLASEWLVDRGRWRAHATGIASMALAALLFVAPTTAVVARTPGALADRSADIFVLSPANLEHSYASTAADDALHVLAMQARNSLVAFNWRGERSEQHSHRAPLLDFWSGALFAVGLIAITACGWRRRYRLVVAWFWSNLILGSWLTVDAMFSPRMIVAVPVVVLFPALVASRFCSLAERSAGRAGKRAATALVLLFLAAGAAANHRDYFDLHARRLQPAGAPTILSRFVGAVNDRYRVYVYGGHSLKYDTPRFLVPDADGASFQDLATALPLARVPAGKGAVFVVDATWDGGRAIEAAVLETHPASTRSTLRFESGRPAFEVFRVDPAADRGD